jgi:hypothetical protein
MHQLIPMMIPLNKQQSLALEKNTATSLKKNVPAHFQHQADYRVNLLV